VPHDKLAAAPFGRAPVGSGRFRFVKWVPGQSVEIGADPDNYRGRAHLDRVVWSISPDFGSATISLINGESDFFEAMRPDAVGQLARNSSLRVVPYPGLDYAFLLFNERASDGSGRPHPIFGDREVRRALTMAVDRPRLVQSVFDSLATTSIGPVPQAIFPDGPKLQQIPFNLARARQLLDSLGWTDPDGDGVRARGGVPLAFTIVVPASSVSRQRAAVLLQEQLRAAGARVELESVEINAFMDRQAKHTFDATMGAWRAEPSPGGILQTWGSEGGAPATSNFGSYVNPAFTATADSALGALDPKRSRAHWLRAFQTIVDDAPAIWLYEQKLIAGAHRRIELTNLRADGWSAGLADWTIPLTQRISRDRVGLR
jgi:peptide/nickel transport system substrate-binding protein